MTKPFSSRFRTTFSFLTLGLVLAFPPLALRAGDLALALPEDCLAFAEARSLPDLLKAGENPLVKKLLEGEMKRVVEILLEGSPENAKADKIFEEETGKTPKEVRALFSGAVAAGFILPWEQVMLEKDFSGVGLVVAADFSGDEELVGKTLLGWVKARDAVAEPKDPDHKPGSDWPEDFEEAVSDVDGVSLHEWLPKDRDNKNAAKVTWALTGGRLVFCLGDADMREVLRRVMKKSDAGSLAAGSAYKEMEAAAGESDVLGGLNLEKGIPSLTEAIRKKIEKEGPPKGVPINILQAMHGAGLDHLRGLFLSGDLEEGSMELRTGLTYAEKPLLLKFYAVSGPGEAPLFTPDDVSEVTWGTLDWGGMFDGLKELITEVFPMGAAAVDMGVLNVKNRAGVDLRKEILGQMGPGFWSMSVVKPPTDKADGKPAAGSKDDDEEEDGEFSSGPPGGMAPGTSLVLGVALRDSKAFSLSLGTVFNTLAPGQALFEDRDYLGNTIHEVKGPGPGFRMAWLIKEDTLVVSMGEQDLLEKALAGMEKKPAEPLLERDHVKKAFARLPGDQFSSTYSAGGVLLDTFIQGLKNGVKGAVRNTGSSGELAKAIMELPDRISFPFFSVSRIYLSEKAAEVRMRFELNP